MRRIIILLLFISLFSSSQIFSQDVFNADQAIDHAGEKIMDTLRELSFNPTLHPAHTNRNTGKWDSEVLKREEWTSGFFAGTLWYMHMLTGDLKWNDYAKMWTEDLEPMAHKTIDHDTGFRIFNSYGNGYKITNNRYYYRTLLKAAQTLSSRFDPEVGAIKSWDWLGNFPVIIDNLMNLELLFWVADETQNKELFQMAVTHAKTSMTHHIRDNGSSYHIVDFNEDGDVLWKGTRQGYGPNSVWSRGQAWAVYGFTMIYRYTEESVFLDTAKKTAEYFIDNLPEDFIPPYDYLESEPSVRTKDASAAAIAASGLLELYTITNEVKYFDTAQNILISLSNETYTSFDDSISSILKRSTLHRGAGNLGTSYADYYYLESILRYLDIVGEKLPERTEGDVIFYLDQNYPNPFNNSTTIFFSVPENSNVELSMYNIQGQKVMDIENNPLPAGNYRRNVNASALPSGVYFYALRIGNDQIVKKMTLVK